MTGVPLGKVQANPQDRAEAVINTSGFIPIASDKESVIGNKIVEVAVLGANCVTNKDNRETKVITMVSE